MNFWYNVAFQYNASPRSYNHIHNSLFFCLTLRKIFPPLEIFDIFFCFHCTARPLIRALVTKNTNASVSILEKRPVKISKRSSQVMKKCSSILSWQPPNIYLQCHYLIGKHLRVSVSRSNLKRFFKLGSSMSVAYFLDHCGMAIQLFRECHFKIYLFFSC